MLNCIDRVRVMKPLLYGASFAAALWVRTMRKSPPFE